MFGNQFIAEETYIRDGMSFGGREEGYSGSSAYLYIDKMIKNRESTLDIVCPFISAYYARMLMRQSSKKRIRIITSNSRITKQAAMMMRKGGIDPVYIKMIVYTAILLAIFVLLDLYFVYVAMIPVIMVLVAIPIFRMGRKRQIQVKTAHRFVHEKLYISSSYAITGSANLTYGGTHRNVEHISVVKDEEELDKLSAHFEELWRSAVSG